MNGKSPRQIKLIEYNAQRSQEEARKAARIVQEANKTHLERRNRSR